MLVELKNWKTCFHFGISNYFNVLKCKNKMLKNGLYQLGCYQAYCIIPFIFHSFNRCVCRTNTVPYNCQAKIQLALDLSQTDWHIGWTWPIIVDKQAPTFLETGPLTDLLPSCCSCCPFTWEGGQLLFERKWEKLFQNVWFRWSFWSYCW